MLGRRVFFRAFKTSKNTKRGFADVPANKSSRFQKLANQAEEIEEEEEDEPVRSNYFASFEDEGLVTPQDELDQGANFRWNINPKGGQNVPNELRNQLFLLHQSNPEYYTPAKLSEQFPRIDETRMNILLQLKRMEWTENEGAFSKGEIPAEEEDVVEDDEPKLESDTRLSELTSQLDFDDRKLQQLKDMKVREPQFVYLNDDEIVGEKLPPVTRTSAKILNKKLRNKGEYVETPEKARARQRNVHAKTLKQLITCKTNYSLFQERPVLETELNYGEKNATGQKTNNKWKIAIRDLSRPDDPLLMRDADGTLRLATEEEAVARTWVQRDPFFNTL